MNEHGLRLSVEQARELVRLLVQCLEPLHAIEACTSTSSTSQGQRREKNCRHSRRNNKHGLSP
jgi:hypothetical protein